MKIKYSGPRPFITHHGVTFKDGKEDKYVYLMIGIQILQAIDKDFGEKKSYSYDITTKRLSNEEILNIMLQYEPSLEKDTNLERISYEEKLDEEIYNVSTKDNLTELEKEILANNLKIMKEYRIQRAINKIYYMHNIYEIGSVIKREKITEIDTPFYEKYWHVLRTIQGELTKGKSSINTELKIEENAKGDMVAKLLISNI
ncbi:hypothetical protein [Sulfurospirillum arcachonense]|uniref:hypothetical protein n=1 Tax=Sulfurospirillum arcachonense TaxID=57666 RepID=UPI0004692BCD|nr:hypothetical protein [Sulfurospirillum arcachonense]